MFKTVDGKLGNMRKEANWVLYPQLSDSPDMVIIQCGKRIAKVSLTTGKAILSSGKGGHQGSHMLSVAFAGASIVTVPEELLKVIREHCSTNKVGNGIGSVVVCG